MSDQSKLGLGQIITTPQQRDAIHIAVAPVKAAARLVPGQHVAISKSGHAFASEKSIGVVDPFLREEVTEGETFWLFLHPGSITSLRHEWSHPNFAEESGKPVADEHAKWIQDFADRMGQTYETIMYYASTHEDGKYGDYIIEGGRYEGEGTPDEFWIHYEAVTGKKGEGSFFSCSC